MLQEASAVGLVKLILILLLIYFGVKTLMRLFAPLIFRFVTRKAQQGFDGKFNNQNYNTKQNEGEVTIDKMPKQNKSNNNVGDYVDYEEIE